MIKIYRVDFFEGLEVPENRIYDLKGIPISGDVHVYALNKKRNRISVTNVEAINNFIYIPDEFEIDSEIEVEYSYYTEGEDEKQMKKSDLKTGMKVVLRNGEEYIVSIDKGYGSLISIDGYGMNSISSYREDLKCMCIYDAEWDICEIYKAQSSSAYTDTKWVSVWERADIPKIKEVTIKDIENKLGYKIKIVDKI